MEVRAGGKGESDRHAVTIVVSFRERWRFTSLTVESILSHTSGNFSLWLLDPGLPDEIRDALKPYVDAGSLELIQVAQGKSPTYWRAQIAPELTSPYAVFIDNDVVVAPAWLDELVACAEETGAGIVCPLYLWGNDEHADVIHMAGGKLSLVPSGQGFRMAEEHIHDGRRIADVSDDLQRKPCGFGEYHCLLMRREVYSADGIFDPGIETVHEHIHASMLARELGFGTWTEPSARVTYLAFAEWRVGELREFRTRWDFAAAERSLARFARRWDIIDDDEYRLPIRHFLINHAGHGDVLDPRPELAVSREQTMRKADLETSFAGLQSLALNRGYDNRDILLLRRAYRLAMSLSAGLYRPCGRPFINHLAGTASVLLFYGCPLQHVLAGLLHAAHTHGPKSYARQWLCTFARAGDEAKAASRLAKLYAQRSKLFDPGDFDGTAIDQLTIEDASLYVLDAANEIDMHLSLEVAVSRRSDVHCHTKLRNFGTVLKRVGLTGMAETLKGLRKELGLVVAVPFQPGQTTSFRMVESKAGEQIASPPATSDLWVVTCYFNPCRYRTKRKNFDTFMDGMSSVGANVLVVELAFGDEPFELPAGDRVLQLRGKSLMWQKERLLNIAAAAVPRECPKIAWLDCDVLFDDPRWLQRSSEALDKYLVIQPFSTCVRLRRGESNYSGAAQTYESFAHAFVRSPAVARRGHFSHHGHTGFAWAARRELFDDCGLYDRCLSGSGDHLMAHTFAGGLIHTPCFAEIFGGQQAYNQHFWSWARKARDLVGGKIGVVPGLLLHLWHGDLVNRRYSELNRQFKAFDFDPDRHIGLDASGLFEWSDDAPQEMLDWSKALFWLRREDGDDPVDGHHRSGPVGTAAHEDDADHAFASPVH
jgi:Glycosyl transferase family 2